MVERLPDPDGTFASYTPTPEDNFRRIAKNLSGLMRATASKMLDANREAQGSPPYDDKSVSDAKALFFALSSLSRNEKHTAAPFIATGLKTLYPEEVLPDDVPPPIREALTTEGFLTWATKQTPEVATGQAAGGRSGRG